MSASLRRSAALIAAFLASFVVVTAPPTHASCAEPRPPEQAIENAHSVFVGTVTGLLYGGRIARFDVEEVWKGDVGALAVVSGGPTISEFEEAAAQGLDMGTSVDRTYELGTKYLVVAHGADADSLLDNGCSMTQPFSTALDTLRPASAHVPAIPPGSGGDDDGSSSLLWIGLAVVAMAGGGVLTLMIRSRHRRFPSGAARA